MSNEPDSQLRTWIIGSPILMGMAAAGVVVALFYPQGLEFALKVWLLGGLIGLAVGIVRWLWRAAP